MPYGNGFPAKFRMVTLFYGGVEGIHIDVYDFSFGRHAAKIRIPC
jgi:hypothetical protein